MPSTGRFFEAPFIECCVRIGDVTASISRRHEGRVVANFILLHRDLFVFSHKNFCYLCK